MKRLLAACGLVWLWTARECGERLPLLLRAAWRVWCLLGGCYLAGYFLARYLWMR